jgi:hypothetical protein
LEATDFSGVWKQQATDFSGVWKQQGPELSVPSAIGQGYSVSLASDGMTLLVGTRGLRESSYPNVDNNDRIAIFYQFNTMSEEWHYRDSIFGRGFGSQYTSLSSAGATSLFCGYYGNHGHDCFGCALFILDDDRWREQLIFNSCAFYDTKSCMVKYDGPPYLKKDASAFIVPGKATLGDRYVHGADMRLTPGTLSLPF